MRNGIDISAKALEEKGSGALLALSTYASACLAMARTGRCDSEFWLDEATHALGEARMIYIDEPSDA